MYKIDIFAKFIDHLLIDNPLLDLRYNITSDRLVLFHNTTSFFEFFDTDHILNWSMDGCRCIGITTMIKIITSEIKNHFQSILKLTGAHTFVCELIDRELKLFCLRLKSKFIPHKIFSPVVACSTLDIPDSVITIPIIFWPAFDNFINVRLLVDNCGKMVILNGQVYNFESECFINHRYKHLSFDLYTKQRIKHIINQKLLVYINEFFNTVLVTDIVTFIMKLCFDVCYWDTQ